MATHNNQQTLEPLQAGPALRHWPAEAAEKLHTLIAANAHKGAYAVFDADNTTYHHDLVGALLPFMEMRGVLTRDTMHPVLRLIPFLDSAGARESLHSYYFRLGEIDDQIGYPWASQIFAGFTLRELKGHLDDLLAWGKPIPAQVRVGDRFETLMVEPPRLQRGQQELYNTLMRHGIEVFVVSAAAEELVASGCRVTLPGRESAPAAKIPAKVSKRSATASNFPSALGAIAAPLARGQ